MSHSFEVSVRWKEGFRGEALPGGVDFTVPFAVPKEFGGPGGAWTPEHFLTAAVNSCIMATFLSIAQVSKLAIAAYESRASSTLEKTDGGLRITKISIEPRIVVGGERDRERAQRLIEKAEAMCPISNSLKATVSLAAKIETTT